MSKFIACIMAGNCEKYIELCIKAIEPQVDKVIVCYDTSSKDNTYTLLTGAKSLYKDKLIIIERKYEHALNCKTANGDQRNFYLEYLKQHYMNDWVLCLDADEVVDENVKEFKNHIVELEQQNINLLSPKMEHFIGDFGHVDATHETHYVLNRLFKIHNELFYPPTEHPILQTTKNIMAAKTEAFTIFHLAYCREMFYIRDRYLNHLAKSEIHTTDFLQDWTYAHYTGQYPKRNFDITKLPKVLKDDLYIDEDYFYFRNRDIETKHFLMARQYQDYFKPTSVLNCGDGIGIFTRAFETIGNGMSFGFDLSRYAVSHTIANDEHYWQDNILEYNGMNRYDLVTAMDLLEHLDEKDLDSALKNIYRHGNKFIFSIPFEGDPNFYADSTHRIFKSKEWWIKQLIDVGFRIEETPNDFLFYKQIILARR